MHVAQGCSTVTHAEAFTLLKFYRCTYPGIHSAAIMLLHSSITSVALIHNCAHSIYASTGKCQWARVHARSHMLALSRVHKVARPSSWVFRAPCSAVWQCTRQGPAGWSGCGPKRHCARRQSVTRARRRLLLRGAGSCCDTCLRSCLPACLPLAYQA